MRSLKAFGFVTGLVLLLIGLVVIPGAVSPAVVSADDTVEAGDQETNKIRHLLRRATFGPRPVDLADVKKLGVEKWIDRQLNPALIPDPEVEKRLEPFETVKMSPSEYMRMLNGARMEGSNGPPKEGENRVEAARRRQQELNRLRNLGRREIPRAVILRAAYSERQLFEVMIEFWRNHFNVDVNKDAVRYYIADWERDVLQKHCFGKFEDLLMATAKHPAMLFYLDNHVSRAPMARGNRVAQGRDDDRISGLNENYARELMELHTVGVDNGYKLKDIIQLALILTGWTIDTQTGSFNFNPGYHAKGSKKVMGKTVKAGDVSEGEQVVSYLAHHKNTREFVVTKMARYLVADEPPAALVKDVVDVWKKTKGDMKAVVRAILTHGEFYKPEVIAKKAKTPFEFVVSCVRATGADVKDAGGILGRLADMQQPVYGCEDPTGYSDRAVDWMDPGVLAVRWQFSYDMLHGRLPGVTVDGTGFFDAMRQNPQVWEMVMIENVFANATPGNLTLAPFRKRVRKVAKDYRRMKPKELGKEYKILATLLLGSPEFQRQ